MKFALHLLLGCALLSASAFADTSYYSNELGDGDMSNAANWQFISTQSGGEAVLQASGYITTSLPVGFAYFRHEDTSQMLTISGTTLSISNSFRMANVSINSATLSCGQYATFSSEITVQTGRLTMENSSVSAMSAIFGAATKFHATLSNSVLSASSDIQIGASGRASTMLASQSTLSTRNFYVGKCKSGYASRATSTFHQQGGNLQL